MLMRTGIKCGLFTVLAISSGPAMAEVLYSNFGPGDSYSTTFGATIGYGGPVGGPMHEAAVPFTITGGDYYLDMAEVALHFYWGPDLVHADILADDGGAPGSVLESTTGSGALPPPDTGPPVQLVYSGSLLLEDGETYWLALRPEETHSHYGWAYNVVDDFGMRAWRYGGSGEWNVGFGTPGTDSQRAVFRITATPVPGPGGALLLVAASLGCCRRRRT